MNIGRLVRTVSYLKPIQIWYQVKYRIFGYKRAAYSKEVPEWSEDFDISIPVLDEDDKYIERFRPEGVLENKFFLLNDEMEWTPGTWNYSDKYYYIG